MVTQVRYPIIKVLPALQERGDTPKSLTLRLPEAAASLPGEKLTASCRTSMSRSLTSRLLPMFLLFLLGANHAAGTAAATHGAENFTYQCRPSPLPLMVNTTSGRAIGAYMGRDVIAWRGIPYAEPPLGALRFEPPRAITRSRAHVIDARQYGRACLQFHNTLALPLSLAAEGESEDCLTVNVFRSVRDAAPAGPLPVLVWVHGGGFGENSGSCECLRPMTCLLRFLLGSSVSCLFLYHYILCCHLSSGYSETCPCRLTIDVHRHHENSGTGSAGFHSGSP
jgi:hypothetical protein